MEVSLHKADVNDAAAIHEMQIKAFTPLLEKYQDYETSPANEPMDKLIARISQPFADYYIIKCLEVAVGGIRVVKQEDGSYRVSPVFILPEYQGQGIAQQVFAIIEQIYASAKSWELATIVQEERNCYLYEKLGYTRTGVTRVINDKMTLVVMKKRL